MSHILNLNTFEDLRGSLTVIEKKLPFDIKRVFYIYGVNNAIRGNHRHKKTVQAAIAINGSCTIYCQSNNIDKAKEYILNKPTESLIILPDDYHWMTNFSKDCVLLVLASEYYDKNDYIFENY